ncbi:DsbA family protein [Streptomyces sp. NPDC096040]|uniref:DsbA family oxidoreductase n=1 Tax=Streptomyces sp. NPDC096040 TaxID=3155541 RepID=UPI003330A129
MPRRGGTPAAPSSTGSSTPSRCRSEDPARRRRQASPGPPIPSARDDRPGHRAGRAPTSARAESSTPRTLLRLGTDVGVPEDDVRRMLDGDTYADAVAADVRQSSRHGATGVPFTVLDRAYGLSGAKPAGTFLSAPRTAHADTSRARR